MKRITAAVIGTPPMVDRVLKVAEEFVGLDLRAYPYQHESEAPAKVAALPPELRLVVFTGPVPYLLSQTQKHFGRDAFFIPFDSHALSHAVYRAREEGQDPARASIDLLDPRHVEETYLALQIPREKVMVLHYAQEIRSDRIAAWHRQLWEQGLTSCVLTCLRSVRDSLSSLGIPVFRLEPPVEAIRATLRLVEARGQTLRAEEGQLAVVLVEVDPPPSTDDVYEREHARLQAQAILVEGGRQMRAAVLHLGGFRFALYTSKGDLDECTGCFRSFPLLGVLEDRLGTSVRAGIGLAPHAYDAQREAERALELARRAQGSSAYVCSGGEVMGPINPRPGLVPAGVGPAPGGLRTAQPGLLALARRAGVSAPTLRRVIQAWYASGGEGITSEGLARTMGTTVRSAQRILRRLTACGLAERIGHHREEARGRPQVIYRLRLAGWNAAEGV